jgi:hypothetical protein
MDFPPGWTCEVVTLRMERYLAMRLPNWIAREHAASEAERTRATPVAASR